MPSRSEHFHDIADRLDAGAVPLHERQCTLHGPATVSVHDYVNVIGQAAISI